MYLLEEFSAKRGVTNRQPFMECYHLFLSNTLHGLITIVKPTFSSLEELDLEHLYNTNNVQHQ